ncbi:MAG: DUF4124 domain-containing protein [Pseudomonadota bacterium]
MKIISIFIIVILSFSASAEMYKWVDAEGNITYSDRPQPGATETEEEVSEVSIPPVNTVPAVDTSVLNEPLADRSQTSVKNSIQVVSPQDDEAIRQNEGNVSISVAIESGLDQGVVAIYLDGNEVSRGQATSVALQNVDRGTHVITADLISPAGKVVASADPVTFHLLRYRIPN